jgi:hypothetical protein
MDKNSVSLSGLPSLCEGRQTRHTADAGIEFPAGFSEQQKKEFDRGWARIGTDERANSVKVELGKIIPQ